MGGACCKDEVVELNPDGTPKDPQSKQQLQDDGRDLRNATKAGDWEQMRLLLRRMPAKQINAGATKDEGDPSEIGNTPLHFSASINHPKGVRKLVRYAHAVSPRNAAGRTPLHIALEGGKLKVATFLLEKKAGINVADSSGASPFLDVVASGRRQLASWVVTECDRLRVTLDFDTCDSRGNSALLYAARYGWHDLLDKWLPRLSCPAKTLNTANAEGETALGCVLRFAASRLVKEEDVAALVPKLLAAGAIATLPAFKERVPPLHLAAASDMPALFDAVRGAMEAVPVASQVDSLGRSALHYAASRGASSAVASLLTMGLSAATPDKQRNTPLHLASMNGHDAVVEALLEGSGDKAAALTQPNEAGLSVYHLSLQAGSSESAQRASLAMIEALGDGLAAATVWIKQDVVVKHTPLLLAVAGHQNRVVRRLLEIKPEDAKVAGAQGLPLVRNLESVTPATYDADADIFEALIAAGADPSEGTGDNHVLLAISKNPVSKFAEKAVPVLAAACGSLDWDRRDTRGYTPLMLAAFHNNVWLVRHLIDMAGISPNDPGQRTREVAPVVVGSSGMLCCAQKVYSSGTPGGVTPLMCAAKGASVGALKMLLSRGAAANAADSRGQTALAYALTLDKRVTLECARVLLAAGARTAMAAPGGGKAAKQMVDLTGESWVHRAVRYGAAEFIDLWAKHGGALDLLATTPETAGDMPGAELKVEEKKDFLSTAPVILEAESEDPPDEVQDDGNGQDSEAEDEAEEGEGADEEADGPAADGAAGPVGEGLLEDLGLSAHVAALIESGRVTSHFAGPSPRQVSRWRRLGAAWWPRFWVAAGADLPPAELEEELGWADKYAYCDAGEAEIDDEEMMEAMMELEVKYGGVFTPDAGSAAATVAEATAQDLLGDAPRKGLLAHFSSSILEASKPQPPHMLRRGAAGPIAEGIQRISTTMEGVCVPTLPARRGLPSDDPASAAAAAAAIESEVNRIAWNCALEMGLTPAVMRQYGLDAPDDLEARLEKRAQPVAESTGGGGAAADGVPAVKSLKSLGFDSGEEGARMYANEPFFQPDTRYQGVPKYMSETEWPWWPKVDCSDLLSSDATGADCYPEWVRAKMSGDKGVRMSGHLVDGPDGEWNARARLKLSSAAAKPVKRLEGPALRMRNIKWYIKSMSPGEFPLKPGQWKAVLKKTAAAVEAAKARRPLRSGEVAKPRKKTAWFGIPDLPSRLELFLTTPMVLAVRLGRAECATALAKWSDSVNVPDGFGITPLQYALLLLVKDRHNAEVKRLVDTLLVQQPFVNARLVAQKYLYPRAKQEHADAAAAGAKPKVLQALALKRDLYHKDVYQPSDHPSVMDPLVLAALLNDMPRTAWMVFKCGGNLNDAFVAMADIPVYFQGLFEKLAGRTRTRLYPLHVGVMHKKFDSVRQMLDMGADPNCYGKEYTGNFRQDLAHKNKLRDSKLKLVAEFAADAAAANPMERTWREASAGPVKMLTGLKRFVMSIEVPGATRPHPWVSPLHLAARFGQAPLAFLLIKRGAAPNGGGAATFAPKSPLEEALAFARANAQVFNTGSKRLNFLEVRRMAYIDESDSETVDAQSVKLSFYRTELHAKAQRISDKMPRDEREDPETLLKKAYDAAGFTASTLALFGAEDLRGVGIPAMNDQVKFDLAMKAVKIAGDLLSFNAVALTMKAVALAAKAIINIFLNMAKRPIAHWDPALYCAHVLLYHRCPYNPNEKQTAIVLRDVLDNGSYGWLDLDPRVIADDVWKKSAVNRILAVKANNDYGYKRIDTATKYKQYQKAKNKFLGAVENAMFNTGMSSLSTAYQLPNLVAALTGAGPGGQPAPLTGGLSHLNEKVQEMLSSSLMDEVVLLQEKVLRHCEDCEKNPARTCVEYDASKFPALPAPELACIKAWGNAQLAEVKRRVTADGVPHSKAKAAVVASWPKSLDSLDPAFQPAALRAAKAKVPKWWVDLARPASLSAVIDTIADGFAGFDPTQQQVKDCDGMPQTNDKGVSMNPFELMLYANPNKLEFKQPEFPKGALAKHARVPGSLDIVDIVKAVQQCHVQKQASAMRAEQKQRSAAFTGILAAVGASRGAAVKAMVADKAAAVKQQAEKMANLELMDWDDDTAIEECGEAEEAQEEPHDSPEKDAEEGEAAAKEGGEDEGDTAFTLDDAMDAVVKNVVGGVVAKASKSSVGRKVASLDKTLSSNPLLAETYKQLKQDLKSACDGILEDMDDPEAMVEGVAEELEAMNEQVLDALENADFEVLEEAVLGLDLDLALDFEAIVEALCDARDALLNILEILDIDLE